MPFVNDADLAKSIREGKISCLYYFYGKDISTIEAYTAKLISKLVKKDGEIYNLHRFDGKTFDISEFCDVCEALPIFADRVCVVINDLDAESLKGQDFELFISAVSNLPDTTTVIIYQTGIDVLNGKKAMSGKNKKLSDVFSKLGYLCDFQYKKAFELTATIIKYVEKQGCTISKQSAEYLATLCLSNMTLIKNELDKLTSYKNGGEITNEIIDLLVSKQLDSNAYALAKAVTSFDEKKAFEILDELFSQQINEIMIVSALSSAFVDLYRARIAYDSGKSREAMMADFDYRGREFVVNNAFRDCVKISSNKLRRYISLLAKTDFELKSTKTENKLLIQKVITEMIVER